LVLVVAQPTVSANSTVAPIILNETRICFIFLVCGCLGDDFVSKREFAQEFSQTFWALPIGP